MKKVTMVLAALVLTAGATNAQKKGGDGTTFGVKAGVNFCSIKATAGSVSQTTSGYTGFAFGGYANLPVSSSFSIQPELFYNGEGAKDVSKFSLGLINIPVLAKYKVSEGVNLFAGPQLGFVMSANVDGTDVKDAVNSTNFSGVFGAEYMLESGIGINARYQMGFSNLAKNSGAEMKSNLFSIGLSYKIK